MFSQYRLASASSNPSASATEDPILNSKHASRVTAPRRGLRDAACPSRSVKPRNSTAPVAPERGSPTGGTRGLTDPRAGSRPASVFARSISGTWKAPTAPSAPPARGSPRRPRREPRARRECGHQRKGRIRSLSDRRRTRLVVFRAQSFHLVLSRVSPESSPESPPSSSPPSRHLRRLPTPLLVLVVARSSSSAAPAGKSRAPPRARRVRPSASPICATTPPAIAARAAPRPPRHRPPGSHAPPTKEAAASSASKAPPGSSDSVDSSTAFRAASGGSRLAELQDRADVLHGVEHAGGELSSWSVAAARTGARRAAWGGEAGACAGATSDTRAPLESADVAPGLGRRPRAALAAGGRTRASRSAREGRARFPRFPRV